MKLMFMNSSLTGGGSERAMTLVANQMVDIGHEVEMVLLRNKTRTYYVDPRITIRQFVYSGSSKLSMFFERLKMIRDAVKKSNPDCVITFMWDLNVMVLAATIGLNVRKVISERCLPDSDYRSVFSKLLERSFYGLADGIVYQTEGARKFCPKRLKSRSYVIPNIVLKSPIKPHIGKRQNKVVSVGRLTKQKNFSLLLDTFARFHRSYPSYRLEIYGEGELRSSLEAQAKQLGISDFFELKGYVADVAACINDAAMFVLSSDYEGISNAMTEAMALGLPVICTDCPVGGAAMMIQDEVNGLLVPVRDSDAMTSALCRLAKDVQLQSLFSEEAKKVSENYSAARIANLWEGVLDVR